MTAIRLMLLLMVLAQGVLLTSASFAQALHPVRKQIHIANIQKYPQASVIGLYLDNRTGAAVDVYLFPINRRPLTKRVPDSTIYFYLVRRNNLDTFCRGERSVTECLLISAGSIPTGSPFHRLGDISDSTDVWAPDTSAVIAERTEYSLAVSPGGLSLYLSKRVYAFSDGRPIQIRKYNRPFMAR